MPSYHTNWELLQDQRPEERARLFMAGCKELGITGDPLLKDLCDVLDCLPDAYPNGETEPSLDAVIKILDKYSDSISKPDEDNLRGQIDELRKASVSEHHKLSVSTNTYLFAFTLGSAVFQQNNLKRSRREQFLRIKIRSGY